jgi:flagellar biosynthesis GTPase FlhF
MKKMVQYTIKKNRVIIRDEHVGYSPTQWKTIMRQVIGRHYSNLHGNGSAWSFSSQHLETFSKLISESQQEETNSISSSTESQQEETNSISSSTEQQEEETNSISSSTEQQEEETNSISSSTEQQEEETNSISSSTEQQEEETNSISSSTEQQEEETNSISSSTEQQEEETNSISSSTEQPVVFDSISTQTDWQEQKLHTYLYDVDENLKNFVKNWINKNIKD